MAKKDNQKNGKNGNGKRGKEEVVKNSLLSNWVKRWIKAIVMFLVTIISVLSFPYFDKAGYAGEAFISVCNFLIGKAYYTIPLFFFVAGLIFLKTRKKGKDLAMGLALIISLVGVSGILAVRDIAVHQGNWVGWLLGWLLVHFFGIIVANIVFAAILLIGIFIFLQFIWTELPKKDKEEKEKPAFRINTGESDNFKVKGIEQEKTTEKPTAKPATSKISLFKKGGEEGGPE